MFCWHHWLYHNKTHKSTFMGEDNSWEYGYLRYCDKCDKVQKMNEGMGIDWSTCSKKESEIFHRKLNAGELKISTCAYPK